MKHILFLTIVLLSAICCLGQTLPDNIMENDCNRPLEGSAWNIHLLASSPDEDIASYSPILVGDIDGNGVCDIVAAKYNGNNYRSREINVYSGLDLSLQYTFTVPDTIYLSNGPYAIGRYPLSDGSMQGAIFTHCYDKRIRAYAIDGTLLNVSDRPTSCDGMVSLADFNGDGYPEVYSGSDIFDAATLKWLCSGPSNGNKGLSHRGAPSNSNGTYHHTYYTMSLAYDALGDAKQELICGNTIYYVNIISRTNPSQNSVTVARTIAPPNGFSSDGHVCMADFDLDGETEILVIRDDTNDQIVDDTYFYAYKPSNGQILFQRAHECASTSYVFIGNTDSDPHPEIIFLENQPNGYYEEILCWRYNPQIGLETVWSQYHDDRSGQTAMTLFDFNQDNIMELVYRDNNHLRIINASGKSHITGNDTIRPYNIYTRSMAAGTGIEYPVVADINGDGHAEVVVTGLLDQYFGYDVGYGGIHVFGCPGNWSSARPVWNQYMYHVTNVNEDLTTPTYCFNTATVFTGSDGTIRRPYNNFLQQAYYITPQGEPIGIHGNPQYVDLYGVLNGGSYEWNGTFYTQPGDYTQYFIDINGCDSIVTLHLSAGITDFPDNILESNCNIPLPSFAWGIREDWSSSTGIYCRINPLVGDLDDDGIPEIVCFDMEGNSPSQTAAKTINVYDGQSKVLKTQISVDNLVWAHGNGPFGLVKLPNRKGLIVTACKDTKLYAYDITAANPSNPVWLSNASYNTGNNDFSVSIGFADFDGDGHPEVYVRNKIFNAETGVLLATAQGGNNQANSYSHNSHTNHNKLSCPLAYDICGDERQELILGNEIYDVVITNHDGTSGNHATLTKTITPPDNIIADGHVQVADFNLDGHPDILVSNRDTEGSTGTVSFYVWDVFNNLTSTPIKLSTSFTGKSIPLIADFDNDGSLEILIDCCHESNQGLRAYHFNPNDNSFQYLWSLFIDEDSYSNTATLFDFNNDNIAELLYSDNSHLRIYDVGRAQPVQLSVIDCGEISIMHIPLVVDVDNDNSADIVVTGIAGGEVQANTMLKVFKSSTEPWKAARKVWNQYMYHVTNVNEDLTLPTFCFNTGTAFLGSDGIIRKPYNNFLQQAGYITQYGEPYNPDGTANIDIQGSGCSSFTFHGIEYTESGVFEQLIESPDGCDTLYHIQVELNAPVTFQFWKTRCHHYTWNDSTYYESGDYQQTFTSIDGCDSIVTLHLTITDTITREFERTRCKQYIWNGTYYSESGDYTQSFVTPQGCDSIVTLHLTITGPVYNEWSYQTCDDFEWNNIIYTEPGDYTQTITTQQGCDSIVTLHLNIADTLTYEWSAQSCTDFTWNGITYDESGDYPQFFVTSHGCDSMAMLHLGIYEPYKIDIDTTACGSMWWNGQELNTSGFYQAVFDDANGCDSLVRLQLTIDPFPNTIPEIEGPRDVYVSSNIISGLFTYSIDSVPFATHYQWILNHSSWIMDTTGLQCQLLITYPGTDTLRVRAWNNCGFSEQEIIIHAGFFNLHDDKAIPMTLYPNPTHNIVVVEAKSILKIKLFDLQGQCLMEQAFNKMNRVELSLPSLAYSLYLVEIQTEYGIVRKKLKTEPQ